jgi:hypothetical protein
MQSLPPAQPLFADDAEKLRQRFHTEAKFTNWVDATVSAEDDGETDWPE